MRVEQRKRIASAPGFIAALDQSGGSTPGALQNYGIEASAFSSDAEMFDLVHAMRSRILTSSAFDGDRIVGAILFEQTMDRHVEGLPTAEYLWQQKKIVPFLKVDQGLSDLAGGVQVLKPIPGLADLLERARDHGMYGTKMRSVIANAVVAGVCQVVDQQFEIGQQIVEAGLTPIIEPEVAIGCPDKAEAEALLREQLEQHVDALPAGTQIMLKLTLPDRPNFYADLVADPRVLRVAALSGGYSRDEATERLEQNHGMIASFSRALVQGLSVEQTKSEFDSKLDETIASIYAASVT